MATKKNKGTVGVIGMGIMGGAFARNLAADGWHVIGYDPSKQAAAAAKRAGVEIAGSARDVARKAPVILTSLPKPAALHAVARELAGAKLPKRTLVEMSTFMIEDKEKARVALEKAGHTVIDCPVSGTGSQAANRDLVFYASGDKPTVKKLDKMFQSFGRKQRRMRAWHCDPAMPPVVLLRSPAEVERWLSGAGPAQPPAPV